MVEVYVVVKSVYDRYEEIIECYYLVEDAERAVERLGKKLERRNEIARLRFKSTDDSIDYHVIPVLLRNDVSDDDSDDEELRNARRWRYGYDAEHDAVAKKKLDDRMNGYRDQILELKTGWDTYGETEKRTRFNNIELQAVCTMYMMHRINDTEIVEWIRGRQLEYSEALDGVTPVTMFALGSLG